VPIETLVLAIQEISPPRRYSVIIVHRGGAPMLLQALAALAAAISPERDEVVVVDNNSGDDSIERLRMIHPEVRVLANAWNLGFARACNQAIAQVSAEYVLLLNNDAFVAADVLDRFEEAFRRFPRLGVIGGQLVGPDGRAQPSDRLIPNAWDALAPGALRRRSRRRPLGRLFEVEAVTGACLAVRATAINEVGPLDEDFFFYLEDLEWCRRMRAHGWTVASDPEARVMHLVAASARHLPRGAQIEMLRSRLLLNRKIMYPAVAGVAEAGRFLRLIVNALFQLFTTGLTAGLLPGPRRRLAKYAFLAAWMILGKPASWGLPDKPPPRAQPLTEAAPRRPEAETIPSG
jgi:GT2 family glycosyltransferase